MQHEIHAHGTIEGCQTAVAPPSRTASTSREPAMSDNPDPVRDLRVLQAELDALETQITNMETTIKALRAANLRSDLRASVLLEGIRAIVRKSRRVRSIAAHPQGVPSMTVRKG
jgi:hypothetical protein